MRTRKPAPVLTDKDTALIIKARRGGMTWEEILPLFPVFKRYHHLRWAMVKVWPHTLPPCGEFTHLESLVDLYKRDLLGQRHVYKVLGEQTAFESHKERVILCRQWYGLDFHPAICPTAKSAMKQGGPYGS